MLENVQGQVFATRAFFFFSFGHYTVIYANTATVKGIVFCP